MRRIDPRRAAALGTTLALAALIGAGPSRRKPTDPPREPLKVEETIGDVAYFSHAGEIPVEGVGLVVGLDHTGSDPEPSFHRQKLLDEMRKAGVQNPDKILASDDTALVLVRTKIPPGITTKDKFDVEIELTPASTTTSLAGGSLISARLTETLVAKGEVHEGNVLAVAWGPVMTGNAERPDDPKVGRVLGGTHVKRDLPHAVVIKENRKSIRTAQMIEGVIRARFHQTDGIDHTGLEAGMASAKSDEYLTIKVPPIYHQNQEHFFRVVKLLPVLNAPSLRAGRLERWGKELLDPKTSGIAALRLEGAGPNAIEVLKEGLESENERVRFFAAESLAYLDDTSGVDILYETSIKQPEFRLYALAALSAMDQPASILRLRKLMDEADVEVRYGAFDALKTHDKNDAYLGEIAIYESPEINEDDSMSMAIVKAGPRRRGLPEAPFSLYVVDSEGPPLVHVSRSRRCEVVLFGKGQELLTPLVLGNGGAVLLNASTNDRKVQISHISPGTLDGAERKISCSTELSEVVRRTAQIGATYPEIVSILLAADRQKNLPGPLVVDAAPQMTDAYQRALLVGDDGAKKDDDLEQTKLEEKSTRRFRLFDRLLNRR